MVNKKTATGKYISFKSPILLVTNASMTYLSDQRRYREPEDHRHRYDIGN